MKKILLILFSTILIAQTSSDIKAKIILKLASITTVNKKISVYVDDPYFYDIFKAAGNNLKRTYDCTKADLILAVFSGNVYRMCKKSNCYIISTNYNDYKKNKKHDLGAFFWQKGRPNLIINKNFINKNHIKIPKIFRKYLD